MNIDRRQRPRSRRPVRAPTKALPGNPCDGHTLSGVIDATESAYVDKGYRDQDTAYPRRVFISGQKRGVFGLIKRELRRRSGTI